MASMLRRASERRRRRAGRTASGVTGAVLLAGTGVYLHTTLLAVPAAGGASAGAGSGAVAAQPASTSTSRGRTRVTRGERATPDHRRVRARGCG
jgi:hypothetical protein